MISIEVVGLEDVTGKLRTMVDPKVHGRIMRSSVRKGMTVMVKSVRGIIPPATTDGHSTESIKRSIRHALKKNPISTVTEAKLGVNVGSRSLETLGRQAWRRALKHGAKAAPLNRSREDVPHSHLYIMGTADRFTGKKVVDRKQEIITTKTGKVRIKHKGTMKSTGNPRQRRGRVMPKDYVTRGVSQGAPQGIAVMRDSIQEGIKAIWESKHIEPGLGADVFT